jgi:uncharacterized membrane protein YraQ (UPF0718 family)
MFSSPTLNVVVLAMVFSLFSPAVVALKLATTLGRRCPIPATFLLLLTI